MKKLLFTGFLTNPKNNKSANWLIIKKDEEGNIVKMFYMGQDGQYHRSVDDVQVEYKFAKTWEHTTESELPENILLYAENCLKVLSDDSTPAISQSLFAKLQGLVK
jgi:hypothetical protein